MVPAPLVMRLEMTMTAKTMLEKLISAGMRIPRKQLGHIRGGLGPTGDPGPSDEHDS